MLDIGFEVSRTKVILFTLITTWRPRNTPRQLIAQNSYNFPYFTVMKFCQKFWDPDVVRISAIKLSGFIATEALPLWRILSSTTFQNYHASTIRQPPYSIVEYWIIATPDDDIDQKCFLMCQNSYQISKRELESSKKWCSHAMLPLDLPLATCNGRGLTQPLGMTSFVDIFSFISHVLGCGLSTIY